jgi:hypothetical protein
VNVNNYIIRSFTISTLPPDLVVTEVKLRKMKCAEHIACMKERSTLAMTVS